MNANVKRIATIYGFFGGLLVLPFALNFADAGLRAVATPSTLTSPTISSPTITGVAKFADGSAAAPSIAFTTTVTNGFFADAATVSGVTSGVTRYFFNSSEFSTSVPVRSAAATPIGYKAGAGGTVTQATSKATGVTLNRATGQITMNGAALDAGAEVTFVVSNTSVAAVDVVIVNHASGGTAGAYLVGISSVGANSFGITVSNVSAGNLSEAIVLNFAVIKGVIS